MSLFAYHDLSGTGSASICEGTRLSMPARCRADPWSASAVADDDASARDGPMPGSGDWPVLFLAIVTTNTHMYKHHKANRTPSNYRLSHAVPQPYTVCTYIHTLYIQGHNLSSTLPAILRLLSPDPGSLHGFAWNMGLHSIRSRRCTYIQYYGVMYTYVHTLSACPSLHLKMQQETSRLAVDESHHPVRHSSP